jgi:hypothetical protein
MGKSASNGTAEGKGSQLVIRIDKAERAAFVTLCEELDTSAAREIRRFMRGFVAAHAQNRPNGADPARDAAIAPGETMPANEEARASAAPPPVDAPSAGPETP